MGVEGIEEMSRAVAIGAVAGLAISVGAALGNADRAPAGAIRSIAAETSQALIEVHVAGWVMSPGVVQLPEGSIVADAVEAAGGFRPGAQVHSINLAAGIRGGDQVFIGGPGSVVEGNTGDGLVHINRAAAPELEALPGVGPVLAERIVVYREDNGPFDEVEDLLDVPGIGESKLASIRDLIRVP